MNNSDSFEVKSLEFPKIYKRTLSDFIDKRYCSTLLGSLIWHVLIVAYFLMNPLPVDDATRASKIQEQIAKTLKERELQAKFRTAKFEFAKRKVEEPVDEVKPIPPKKAEKTEPQQTAKVAPKRTAADEAQAKIDERERRRARARARSSSNKELAASVGSKGLLGLLTSNSNIAQGDEVVDILGNADKSKKDLDEALSGLSGITVGAPKGDGQGDANVRGGRATGGTEIGDLVSGLGEAESDAIERTGDLVVVTGESAVEGSSKGGMAGRTPDEVQAVVLRHNNSIQYCYERQLKRNPHLKGKVVVRFTITPQGTVKDVNIVSSNLDNGTVEQCILSRIRRWNDFGPIDPQLGDTTIRQVYAFGY